jgi:hypothetical protein
MHHKCTSQTFVECFVEPTHSEFMPLTACEPPTHPIDQLSTENTFSQLGLIFFPFFALELDEKSFNTN